MLIGRAFAWSIIALQCGAAGGYMLAGNWRQALFWAGAAVVNVAATV